ncbi:MAG TPA: DUF402 domain-containing protein [Gaiellaceae bacterium]|nr:DUF402 domain-containing protein [Gaiellaceae bacterium]
MSWSPGDTVVYRSLASDARYYSGLPLTVLEDGPDAVVGFLPHGTVVSRPVAADGRDLRELPLSERWGPRVALRRPFLFEEGAGSLVIVFPRGRAYAIWIFRGPEGVIGWYVNLEDPQVFAGRTISTRDHILDLWVPATTGEARWKDEDELEAAVAAGSRTRKEADAYRAEAERVADERPWPTGWEDAEPDPEWPAPELFDGWDMS